jgi:heme iron utilization protein
MNHLQVRRIAHVAAATFLRVRLRAANRPAALDEQSDYFVVGPRPMSAPYFRRHAPPPTSSPSASSSSSQQELLYDPATPSLSHAERARTLAELAPDSTLCTLGQDGVPYGSLVLHGIHSASGNGVLLISEMAEHTRNLRRDSRCSLLVVEPGSGNPLARGRVTLTGTAEVVTSQGTEYRDSFLKKNPSALRYVDFGDFSVWRIAVTGVRYIGGFGRMSWVGVEAWCDARADLIALDAAAANGLVGTLNREEARRTGSLAEVARVFSRAQTVSSVRVTAVDQYGLDFAAETELGMRPIRVSFTRAADGVSDAESLVKELEESAAR